RGGAKLAVGGERRALEPRVERALQLGDEVARCALGKGLLSAGLRPRRREVVDHPPGEPRRQVVGGAARGATVAIVGGEHAERDRPRRPQDQSGVGAGARDEA
ncbi:MAG: hypothetical protein ACK55I_16195, partial [bacterium]